MYKFIQSLKPYFFSLREINDNVSLDIKIPTTWGYNDIALKPQFNTIRTQVQDQNDKNTLLSIISDATEMGYGNVLLLANDIIQTNMEEEEKLKLFNQKMNELKEIFLKSSLDNLKDITFTNDGKAKTTTGIRMADEGNIKGSEGN